MRISVIGLGSIGQRHLRNCLALKDELGLSEVRCYDINTKRAEEVLAQAAGARLTKTLEEAVQDAEAVLVCVPTSKHIPIISEINRTVRCHLFIEKPLSHTLDGCDELLFSQARAKKVTTVGYVLRHHPVIKKMKAMIQAGAVGRPLAVRAESGFYLPYWHPWEDYHDFYMAWKTGGGGALLDSSHEINYLQWIFGEVEEVKGYFGRVSDLEISSDDLAVALFRFKSGAQGQVHLDLLQFDESRGCKVIGTEAVMLIDLTKNTISLNRKAEKQWSTETEPVNFDELYRSELREFVEACRGQGRCATSGEAGKATLEIVEAVRLSNNLGNAVRLPLY